MPKDIFERLETDRHLRDNPLATHLAPFATSRLKAGMPSQRYGRNYFCLRVLVIG